jgi:hypothetical protein
MSRARHLVNRLKRYTTREGGLERVREEEFPTDENPYFMDPRRAGNSGVPRPLGDHYPTKGVGGIPSGSPNRDERLHNQNTFPWNGQPIRNPQQLHVYGDAPDGGGSSSGAGGFA